MAAPATAADLVSAVATLSDVTTFSALLTQYNDGGDVSDDIFSVLIPAETVITANTDTISYLASRPAMQKEFFLNHLANANTIMSLDYAGTETGFAAGTWSSRCADCTAFDAASDGDTALPANGSPDLGAPTLVTTPVTPAFINVADVDAGDAAYAIYDTGLLYDNSLTDSFEGAEVSNDLDTAIGADAASGSFASVGSDAVVDLIKLHAIDALAGTADKWYTIFLPADTATVLAVTGVPEFLMWNRAQAQTVLLNHVIEEDMGVYSEDVLAGSVSTFNTLGANGAVNTISTSGAGDVVLTFADPDGTDVTINVDVNNKDYYVMGAVLHAVDQVMITTAQTNAITTAIGTTNLSDAAPAQSFATLNSLIGLASNTTLELINDVADQATMHKTLLAPTEAAFDSLEAYIKDYLMMEENQDDLDTVLKAHVLTTPLWADVAFSGQDGNGEAFTCTAPATATDPIMCDGMVNATSRVDTENGVSYSIDKVIIPDSVVIPVPESSSSSSDSESDDSSSDSSSSSLAISGVAMAACAAVLALF